MTVAGLNLIQIGNAEFYLTIKRVGERHYLMQIHEIRFQPTSWNLVKKLQDLERRCRLGN